MRWLLIALGVAVLLLSLPTMPSYWRCMGKEAWRTPFAKTICLRRSLRQVYGHRTPQS